MKNQESSEISFEKLPTVVGKLLNLVTDISDKLSELKSNFEPKTPTEYLTTNEVVALLKCDRKSVVNWTKSGKLKKYGLGYKVYFKREEVESAIIAL